MSLDPMTVFNVARWWRKNRIWRRITGRPLERPADEFSEIPPPDEDFMSEAQQSFVRGLLKLAAGALAAKGLIDVGDAAALQIALEALAAGAMGLWAFWQSHRKHTAA